MLHSLQPLQKNHRRSAFHCGNAQLDHYLKTQARQDQARGISQTTVLVRDLEVYGYYSLSNYSLKTDLFVSNPTLKLRGVQYPDIPLHLLGRLAVDIRYRGTGMGKYLLQSAMSRAYDSAQISASVGLITQPIDQNAQNFYSKWGFQPLGTGVLWFLSMKSIALLLNTSHP